MAAWLVSIADTWEMPMNRIGFTQRRIIARIATLSIGAMLVPSTLLAQN